MFILPGALKARGADIAVGWSGSLTMGAGQFCTNPGVVVVEDGADADAFEIASAAALSKVAAQPMLTNGIADAYRAGTARTKTTSSVKELVGTESPNCEAAPNLFTCSADDWIANENLREEVFGPLGIIVRAKDAAQMKTIALALEGQLTTTLHIDDSDTPGANELLPVLERKSGRILINGFPTGVEVCDAMVHGGPYPASTNFGATSVGTMAIRRFLRPVCYQGFSGEVLPDYLSA